MAELVMKPGRKYESQLVAVLFFLLFERYSDIYSNILGGVCIGRL